MKSPTIPAPSPGRPSVYRSDCLDLIKGRKKFLRYDSYTVAQNCSLYFRKKLNDHGTVCVRTIHSPTLEEKEYRVYIIKKKSNGKEVPISR